MPDRKSMCMWSWICKIYRWALFAIILNYKSYFLEFSRLNSDPYFPDLNKCVPRPDCPEEMPCSGINYATKILYLNELHIYIYSNVYNIKITTLDSRVSNENIICSGQEEHQKDNLTWNEDANQLESLQWRLRCNKSNLFSGPK